MLSVLAREVDQVENYVEADTDRFRSLSLRFLEAFVMHITVSGL